MEIGSLTEDEKRVVLGMREKQEVSEAGLFKKGEIIITNCGPYGEYAIKGSFVIDRDFYAPVQLKLWSKACGLRTNVIDNTVECIHLADSESAGFMSWLVSEKFVSEVKYHEIEVPEEYAGHITRLV